MSPYFRLFLLVLALLSFAGPLLADELEVRWEHPTQRVDGSTIAVTDIARTELEYAPCVNGQLGTPKVLVPVPAPATVKLIDGLADGSWCVRARSIDAQGLASDWTATVMRKARPKPPTIVSVYRVAANGDYTTRPVYALAADGKLTLASSRRVAVGDECDPALRQGASYFSVAGRVNALRPDERLPAGSFAYCVQSTG